MESKQTYTPAEIAAAALGRAFIWHMVCHSLRTATSVEAAEELSTACTAEVDRLRRNGANSQAATAALKTIRTAISRAKRAIQNNIPLFVSDEAGAPIPAGKLEAACNTAEGKAPEPKAVKETKEEAAKEEAPSINPDPALVTRIAALEAAILDALRASSLKTAKAILKAAMSA